MRSLCWKCNFRANFGVLPQGFDVKALIPQGFTGSPNYFGFLNNLMTLIICESLREIGEVACVTSAWSSRGQTLKPTGFRTEMYTTISTDKSSTFLIRRSIQRPNIPQNYLFKVALHVNTQHMPKQMPTHFTASALKNRGKKYKNTPSEIRKKAFNNM